MHRTAFTLLGIMLLLSFGCPGEEAPQVEGPIVEPEPVEEEPEEEPEQVEEEPIEEVPEEEEPEPVEEMPAEEEPVVEVECIPVATSGYVEMGIYTEDAKYYNVVEGKRAAYAEKLEIGKTLSLSKDVKITLLRIHPNATCGECGKKPIWTHFHTAELLIEVKGSENEIVFGEEDGRGSFISGYKCDVFDWDGKTCIKYVPTTSHQYYVHRIRAETLCVEAK